MKIKDSLALRQVANVWMVIPVATDSKTDVLLKLNDTGAKLWKLLEQDVDVTVLANALANDYNIPFDIAKQDAQEFVDMLLQNGCLE